MSCELAGSKGRGRLGGLGEEGGVGLEWVVTVQAQVMCWNEKYNGWVPLDGGGVSSVSLLQRTITVPAAAAEEPSAVVSSHPALAARASWSASTTGATATAATATGTGKTAPRRASNGHAQRSASQSAAPVREATPAAVTKFEYALIGKRLKDKKILLNCVVVKDVRYKEVMPTFHHWEMGLHKFGLSFHSSHEAHRFHNKLQKAIEHLHRQSKSSQFPAIHQCAHARSAHARSAHW